MYTFVYLACHFRQGFSVALCVYEVSCSVHVRCTRTLLPFGVRRIVFIETISPIWVIRCWLFIKVYFLKFSSNVKRLSEQEVSTLISNYEEGNLPILSVSSPVRKPKTQRKPTNRRKQLASSFQLSRTACVAVVPLLCIYLFILLVSLLFGVSIGLLRLCRRFGEYFLKNLYYFEYC